MDNLVFEESINAEVEQSEFISRKWIYVNDTNSQNYSTQVIIDTTPLANAGGYVNWSEGYIVMPLVINAQSAAKFAAGGDASWPSLVSMKAGFWQMINSMTVEFNNQTVVQQTPFLNVFRSFKVHTSFSQDDLQNEGATLGYYPDFADTWEYNTTLNADGVGVCNSTTSNTGINQRNEWISYNGSVGNQSALQTSTIREAEFSSSFTKVSTSLLSWKVYAKLRLKDLADYFNKTPLLKGSTIRLLINTNQLTSQAITLTTASKRPIITSTVAQGYTNPLMLNTTALNARIADFAENDIITISCSIFKNVNIAGEQTTLSSCRLYAPVYKMNPISEQRYLSLAPTKKVSYTDIFQYQFNNVPIGQFNFLVSNGIPNIKSVLVVPFLSTASNGALVSAGVFNSVAPTLSPFSTAGATPDPLVLSNFNILVSGVNLFLQNELYSYEQFNHELKSSNQLNGSLTTGLASGLISEYDFVNLYRYYYGNCARVLPSEEGVSRSVQVIGELRAPSSTGPDGASITANLMVFVEFEKTMTIDISTGARID